MYPFSSGSSGSAWILLLFCLAILIVIFVIRQKVIRNETSSLALTGSYQEGLTQSELSSLALSPEELIQRRSWTHRKGMRRWAHNASKTRAWREANLQCNRTFPGCVPPCTSVRGNDFHKF